MTKSSLSDRCYAAAGRVRIPPTVVELARHVGEWLKLAPNLDDVERWYGPVWLLAVWYQHEGDQASLNTLAEKLQRDEQLRLDFLLQYTWDAYKTAGELERIALDAQLEQLKKKLTAQGKL